MKKVFYREYEKAFRELSSKFEDIELYNMNGFGSPICIGVNWYAAGTVSPDEAISFASKIVDAANAAKNFQYNGYEIEY